MLLSVTFTETVERTLDFEIDVSDLEPDEIDDLGPSDVHEMMDAQSAWDQPTRQEWLGGDINERTVNSFRKFPGETKPEPKPGALREFIDTIETTGGVFVNEKGRYVPAVDPQWSDLGAAYIAACEELGMGIMLVDGPVDDFFGTDDE